MPGACFVSYFSKGARFRTAAYYFGALWFSRYGGYRLRGSTPSFMLQEGVEFVNFGAPTDEHGGHNAATARAQGLSGPADHHMKRRSSQQRLLGSPLLEHAIQVSSIFFGVMGKIQNYTRLPNSQFIEYQNFLISNSILIFASLKVLTRLWNPIVGFRNQAKHIDAVFLPLSHQKSGPTITCKTPLSHVNTEFSDVSSYYSLWVVKVLEFCRCCPSASAVVRGGHLCLQSYCQL